MNFNYEEIYKKYLKNKQSLVFNKEEIVTRVKRKFKAEEFSKAEILDLPRDEHFEYEKIFLCLKICDSEVLKKVFLPHELKFHEEQRQDNRRHPLKKSKRKKNWLDQNYNQMIIDEHEGRRIDIVIESKDGQYVSEFKVKARCDYLDGYLNSLMVGAKLFHGTAEFEENIDDYYFKFYLENLVKYNMIG
ncbi:hypothetical protein [Peribacillus sp. SI8-4]|uniref:hypothetical protein n=1 Tax=Peribacillus sp. SI8-4 TaxID=3048009 RepID=UPI002557AD17|nr:hypothetical protein [Peribacillus sp. SI8-4]